MKLYDLAYSLLGKHLTLDDTVDKSVGCAQALSYILFHYGCDGIPKKGLPGTVDIDKWCKKYATKVEFPEVGDLIVSVTGTGNGTRRGHCGVVGKHHIMSNYSPTGLWDDYYTLESWIQNYKIEGDLETNFYHI
jgi:hypothetical protein